MIFTRREKLRLTITFELSQGPTEEEIEHNEER
jgi:hypothetical protein